jgi:hypothetical protein
MPKPLIGHLPVTPAFPLLPPPLLLPLLLLLQGKRQAEEELLRSYPDSGVVLRPWVIYGDRAISAHISLPLGMLFGPLEYALK